jgi:hypothetical protein
MWENVNDIKLISRFLWLYTIYDPPPPPKCRLFVSTSLPALASAWTPGRIVFLFGVELICHWAASGSRIRSSLDGPHITKLYTTRCEKTARTPTLDLSRNFALALSLALSTLCSSLALCGFDAEWSHRSLKSRNFYFLANCSLEVGRSVMNMRPSDEKALNKLICLEVLFLFILFYSSSYLQRL